MVAPPLHKERKLIVSAGTWAPGQAEIVERKGLGHPDSLADGMAEAVSRALCRRYLDEFGEILHHNTDKLQVVGGRSNPFFGGGTITKPLYILLAGRATETAGGKSVGVSQIAIKAAEEYLKQNVRNLSTETDTIIQSRIGEGSAELSKTFERRMANDTSCGAGFSPLTSLERTVLETEKRLNSPRFKKKNPQVGEDIKVMGVRKRDEVELTISAAMVSRHTRGLKEYLEAKEAVRDSAVRTAEGISGAKPTVFVNAADQKESIYLTVSGTSAEMGDDGSAGRGNRANGLITPYRPMTMESTSGKNPVTHVGKIYNILAGKMAQSISRISGAEHAHVYIVSRIGAPVDEPQLIHVETGAKKPAELKSEIDETCARWLGKLDELTHLFVKGKLMTF